MATFDYDPARSFRAWLKTVTQHAWGEFAARRQRAGLGSGDSQIGELLQNVEAREDLLVRLNREFDRELLDEAVARVRLRVEPRTFEAFRLTALEGKPGAGAAQQLGMGVTAVFKAKNRVQKMVQEELRRLEGAE
jgi:RNA polymerase sigma-70 factor (ECF subfamily)